MLGDQLGESKGKRTVRRVLSIDPLTVEVSFEDSGNMLGVATNGMGTYTRWRSRTAPLPAKARE